MQNNASSSSTVALTQPSEPEWVTYARSLLEESRTDIKVARMLSKSPSPGMQRRRLFFLQQSMEKATKSIMPIIGPMVMNLSKVLTFGHLLGGSGLRDDKALEALTERARRLFREYTVNTRDAPKKLGHDPSERLQIMSLLESLYSYSRTIGLDQEIVDNIQNTLASFKEDEPSKIIARIEGEETRREQLVQRKEELKSRMSTQGLSQQQRSVEFWKLIVVPGHLIDMMEIVLYFRLCSCLAQFEQASRYPEEQVPKHLMDSLDIIDYRAAKLIEKCAKLYKDPWAIRTWDNMLQEESGRSDMAC
ncbi:MAG: hypothetical protein HYY22_01175 [Thaumarchaeota archaeon]|nr:hypothetical protein [Nitrososphaerota archaeon]